MCWSVYVTTDSSHMNLIPDGCNFFLFSVLVKPWPIIIIPWKIEHHSLQALFLAHLSMKCSEWAIGITHCPSASIICPSSFRLSGISSHFLVCTLASTNINHSAPNLVKIYITIRSRMSSILGLVVPELTELFALELKKLLYFTLFTLSHLQISTNQHQTMSKYIYDHKISDDFDFGSSDQNDQSYLPLN